MQAEQRKASLRSLQSSIGPEPTPATTHQTEEVCMCMARRFDLLAGREDSLFLELLNYLKQVSTVERDFAGFLLKLSDTSLIDRLLIKEFDDPYRPIKLCLKQVSSSHLDLCAFTEKELLPSIERINVKLQRTAKELTKEFRETSSKFTDTVAYLKTQVKKLKNVETAYQKTAAEYEEAKVELSSFEKLARKEMQMKVSSNEIEMTQNNIKKAQAAVSSESKAYLEVLTPFLVKVDEFTNLKAAQYRSFIQSWLATFEKSLNTDLNALEKATQQGNAPKSEKWVKFIQNQLSDDSDQQNLRSFYNKLVKKKTDVDLHVKQRNSLHEKLTNMRSYLSNLRKFIIKLERIFRSYSEQFKEAISIEAQNEHVGFREKWNEVNNGLYYFAELSEPFADELGILTGGVEEILRFDEQLLETLENGEHTQDLVESVQESFNNLVTKRQEFLEASKQRIQETLSKYIHSAIKAISKLLNLLNETRVQGESIVLRPNAQIHREECPYYVYTGEYSTTLPPKAVECVRVGEPESANWLNALLLTFFEEWTISRKFQLYVCRRLKKIYNKDRPSYIGEIAVLKVEMGTQAPQLKDFTKLHSEHPWEFFYELNLNFSGEIKIELEFEVYVVATVLVNIKVVVRSLFGRLQVYFRPSTHGKSWYSFVSEPAVNIGIEPVIGKSKISLSDFPQLNSFLVNILSRKIRKYVRPNTRSIKIPKGRRMFNGQLL